MAPNKSSKNGTANNHINGNHNNNNINDNNNKSNGKNGSTSGVASKPQKQIKVKKPKTRDSGCCSINFIKYVLIIIDIVFFVSKIMQKSFLKLTADQKSQALEGDLLNSSSCLNLSFLS
jgi:hypothetical protein